MDTESQAQGPKPDTKKMRKGFSFEGPSESPPSESVPLPRAATEPPSPPPPSGGMAEASAKERETETSVLRPPAQVDESTLTPFERILYSMQTYSASDLHLKSRSAPAYRIHGQIRKTGGEPISAEAMETMVRGILRDDQWARLRERGSVDLSISIPRVGRFRLNIFHQRGSLSLCARSVKIDIPSFDQLLLPKAMEKVAAIDQGMVLVVGATGSGKSTTLAAIIDRINQTQPVHIITVEDPIEFVHKDKQAIVNQREIGIDTPDFASALRDALREDPDVILVGELRDSETVETAMSASETGHMVLGTLHSNSAVDTIVRILDFFPPEEHPKLRKLLANTLSAVIGQMLARGCTKEYPRVPVVEILFVNGVIKQCIEDGELDRIHGQFMPFANEGMQSFNMSLAGHVARGLLTGKTALELSRNPKELAALLSASSGTVMVR